jgi:molecular chaperone IbpA
MTKNLTLRSFDIPAIHKFGIGFDNLFDDLLRVAQHQANTTYPPHNVIKTGDDTVTIEVAVAGFASGEITVSVEQRHLNISGERVRNEEDVEPEYIHRGISKRDFKHTFPLAEHVEVKSAVCKDGILTVKLERIVPESAKPKTIAITYEN